MCGIAGGWWALDDNRCDERVASALRLLRHRGPDDAGLLRLALARGAVVLGHARLSIIDLSTAGHQPMSSPDGNFSLVFNGEIYNYRELRSELALLGHHFSSQSDTEVLLHAWAQWGRACLRRLVGMFAFAVHDRQRNTLTLVRDAFGIKPLFYTHEPAGLVFASEPVAVLSLLERRGRANLQRSYDYLVHGDYDSNDETFFEGVMNLLPGHLYELDLGAGVAGSPEQWWAPEIKEVSGLGFHSAVEQVREMFLQSIRLHLRSDVSIGAALSGGIDSSAVVCAMRHVAPDTPINTFSYIARGSAVSEEYWIDRVVGETGAIGHKVVVSGEELARDLDDMIRLQGEPFGSTSIYAQYRVFQLAREAGVTVTLDGQGADEMFAGYIGYPGQRLRSLLETGQFLRAWQFLDQWSRWPGRSRIEGLKRLVGECTPDSLFEVFRRINGMNPEPGWIRAQVLADQGVRLCYPRQSVMKEAKGRRVAAALASSLTRSGLPGLLRHADRNAMYFSVESRVPFLTIDMVELALSMPEEYLVSGRGETKHVFRAAMRGIVPDDVLDRRDKIGFSTPERDWLVGMSDTVRSWVGEDLGIPFIDMSLVRKEIDDVLEGRAAFSWQAWRWINYCRWYRAFVA